MPVANLNLHGKPLTCRRRTPAASVLSFALLLLHSLLPWTWLLPQAHYLPLHQSSKLDYIPLNLLPTFYFSTTNSFFTIPPASHSFQIFACDRDFLPISASLDPVLPAICDTKSAQTLCILYQSTCDSILSYSNLYVDFFDMSMHLGIRKQC